MSKPADLVGLLLCTQERNEIICLSVRIKEVNSTDAQAKRPWHAGGGLND